MSPALLFPAHSRHPCASSYVCVGAAEISQGSPSSPLHPSSPRASLSPHPPLRLLFITVCWTCLLPLCQAVAVVDCCSTYTHAKKPPAGTGADIVDQLYGETLPNLRRSTTHTVYYSPDRELTVLPTFANSLQYILKCSCWLVEQTARAEQHSAGLV